jgi:glycosyltransferase involved in cell wall biosynthesis
MKLVILLKHNPYFENSASSNRIISLLEGLSKFDVSLELIIVNGYLFDDEKTKFGRNGCFNGINYFYANFLLINNKWVNRFYVLLIKPFHEYFIFNIIRKKLLNFKGVVWSYRDQSLFKRVLLKRTNTGRLKFITEISEFPDFYLSQNIPLRHIKELKKNSIFFEKNINEFTGLALMTKSLVEYYKNIIDGDKVKNCHLPMTVDLNRFKDELTQPVEFKGSYILFVGVMNDNKDGVNILIESFAKMKSKYPDYYLYLVGPWQPDSTGHQLLIKKLGLQSSVKWMGEYPRNVIPSIIKNSKLLVLPRPDSRQAEGGFPTKLGEYLASGIPVCATTVGEIPDYLVDNESVFFANPGSIDSFTEAMERALFDPSNAKRIGLNGRKVAEKEFNKDIQAKKLFDFLKEIMNEEPRLIKAKDKRLK